MNDFQFYPTPKSLADRAWAKFKNEFVRVLEPSAGHGDLAKAAPCKYHSWSRDVPIDCIEIDLDKHPVLREEGFKVVGVDFLKFSAGAHYSHIIMNPPFAQGAAHVLKAWDILWDGEIVAIINAETVRNPFCRDRQRLAALIEKHGEVEFIEGAFSTPEAERQADVDVALVYLRKEADASELADAVLEDLIRDQTRGEDLAEDCQDDQELCLPNSVIENAVLAFNAAVESARKAVLAEARASRYAKRLGDTLSQRRGDAPSDYSTPITADSVRNDLAKRYDNLKDRAWAGILSSTQVLSRTSTNVQREIESRFEEIKALEFTAENIYGFLLGLAQNQGQIQIDMACEVFDTITRYHSDNTVFYMGWKSNDKHRTAGMRIKTTRFILPGHSDHGFRMSLPWESRRLLADFDRVFAMLDGKMESPIGLVDVFSRHYQRLKHGERLSSSYFDVRYYPGIGTIHFFPRDKKLIERLNLLVGRHRQWLPPQETRVSKDFWLQYEQAEKFDKAIRSQVKTLFREQAPRRSPHPLHAYGEAGEGGDEARAWLGQAIGLHLEAKGLNVQAMLETMPEPSVAALEMLDIFDLID
ncbi:DUF4942 domain-containing protein [Allochromatium tepidum]|uniref:DUF4942 domain-containing protein n=1 Tax=Allochromatium tepidum TaxID=553982 RepID=A0ABN6GEZ2_9GAMM|nr:DUF4942 domain-containing protein [Allochromatium tepidum]BCU08490.1 hypothetical protein Atep_31670 [Allochromatium tepidum]